MARAEKIIRNGKVTIDGKVLDFEETVALLCEMKNDLSVANQLIDAKQREVEELESELRVKEDLFKIKSAISDNSRPSIEWYECEMAKQLEEISRQKAIINNLVETLYLLKME
jgi:hypothetical protein